MKTKLERDIEVAVKREDGLSEHRHHRTGYMVSVRQHGSSVPSRTWGPYRTKEEAQVVIDRKREEARRMGWNVIVERREPTGGEK